MKKGFQKGNKLWDNQKCKANWFKKGHPDFVTEEGRRKISEDHKGSGSVLWKGGKTKTFYGYVLILNHEHHLSNKQGYVKRCILVMEQKIGRMLIRGEIVHHINEVKDDDRPENLMLFPNESEHQKHHHPKGRKIGL